MERKVTRGVDQPEVEGYQWDGWKLIMIAKLNTNGTFHSRKWSCVWRPDVGSSLYARSDWMRAGGVGGVAWLQTGAAQSYSYGTGSGEVHVPLADHMGNVRHYYQFKASGSKVTGQLVASYEYDAFGREVRAWGLNTPATNQPPGLPASRPWADLLPFHYSSKLRDVDSGFNYYGYRFYDPGAGRWLNRDPIGERGGVNLYGMVGNDAVGRVDVLGLARDCQIRIIVGHRDVPLYKQINLDKAIAEKTSGNFPIVGLHGVCCNPDLVNEDPYIIPSKLCFPTPSYPDGLPTVELVQRSPESGLVDHFSDVNNKRILAKEYLDKIMKDANDAIKGYCTTCKCDSVRIVQFPVDAWGARLVHGDPKKVFQKKELKPVDCRSFAEKPKSDSKIPK